MWSAVLISNAPIIGSVISIGRSPYLLMGSWYRSLFLVSVSVISQKDVTDIVKSAPIMSFLVIIASLIAFMILIIIEKMIFFVERIRNQ